MIERRIQISNQLGLHARAAAKLVHTASSYACDVQLEFNGHAVDAKSILGLMLLAAPYGEEVLLRCNGDEEDQAMKALVELFTDRFGEES